MGKNRVENYFRALFVIFVVAFIRFSSRRTTVGAIATTTGRAIRTALHALRQSYDKPYDQCYTDYSYHPILPTHFRTILR